MKLTLQIEDNDLSLLKDSLRISLEQFRNATSNPRDVSPETLLAYRILKARKALDLSNSTHLCCHDFVMPTE